MTDEQPTEIGPSFEDTLKGRMRMYWFVGGLGSGVMGVGTVLHWGKTPPATALIIGAGVLLIALVTAKQRGEWDV